MKDLSGKEWDYDKGEKYAIQWFEEHGFDVTLKKRYISKDVFEVSKDGVTDTFELPLGNKDIKYRNVMEQFEKNFSLLCELQKLRAEHAANR
jgi:hypothetical protein